MKQRVYTALGLLLVTLFLSAPMAHAQVPDKNQSVGVDEKLGAYIPGDITLTSETGEPMTMSALIGEKPTLLTMVYYHCPGVCTPYLAEMATLLNHMEMVAGRDFNVVAVSFDENETPTVAAQKKQDMFKLLTKDIGESGWRFMTADKANIDRLAEVVGFKFERVDNDFLHPSVLMAISPKGEIVRYLFGKNFLPFDVTMALTEASEGRVGPTINKVLQYCFSYDPEGKKYVFNILRVTGTVVVSLALLLVVYLIFQGRARKKEQGSL